MLTIVKSLRRADAPVIAELAARGVATVHEAQDCRGLMAPAMRPIFRPCAVAGSAVTCAVPAGDSLTLHVAIEQCQPGDILVVSPVSPCEDGYAGELIGTSLMARGVAALVIDAGVRDIAALTRMGFPVWSKAVSAKGCVKQTLLDVNRPVVCAGALVSPGDIIVADDDGVCVVKREEAESIAAAALRRETMESEVRSRLAAGELSLDIAGIRDFIASKNPVVEEGR